MGPRFKHCANCRAAGRARDRRFWAPSGSGGVTACAEIRSDYLLRRPTWACRWRSVRSGYLLVSKGRLAQAGSVLVTALALGLMACTTGTSRPVPPLARSGAAGSSTEAMATELVPTAEMSLIHAPGDSVPRECRRAAGLLDFAIPCPGLLPQGSFATVLPGGPCAGLALGFGPGCDGAARALVTSIQWPAAGRIGHLVIMAAPGSLSPAQIVDYPHPPETAIIVVGHRTFDESPTAVVLVAESEASIFGGHTVLVWRHRGVTYALGFHGQDPEAIRLDQAVADSIRWVS